MWKILDINYNHFYQTCKSQVLAGAGYYFRPSKPHSGTLWPFSAFTLKNLFKQYAEQVLIQCKLTWNWDANTKIIMDRWNVKAIEGTSNLVGAFSVFVKTPRRFVSSSTGWYGARGGMSHVQSGHSSTFHHSIVLTPGCWMLMDTFWRVHSFISWWLQLNWIDPLSWNISNAVLYEPVTGRIFSMAVNLLLLHYSHF